MTTGPQEPATSWRHSRWLRFTARLAWVLMMAVLSAELVARVATYAARRVGVARAPEVAQTIDFARKLFFPHYTKEELLGDLESYPAPVFHSDGRVEWATFGTLPAAAFRSPPANEAPT